MVIAVICACMYACKGRFFYSLRFFADEMKREKKREGGKKERKKPEVGFDEGRKQNEEGGFHISASFCAY